MQIKDVLENGDCGQLFLESFFAGREFTALCTGSKDLGGVKVYIVAERVFNPRLSGKDRILGFDKCLLFKRDISNL